MTTAIITGASVGIGLETAKGLARKGFDLILVSRNIEKLKLIKSNLENNFNISCNVLSYDLSLIKSNIEFYNQIIKSHQNIDVLINNVGAIFMDRTVTSEGIEKTFALNHMSYFTLSKLFIESFSIPSKS